MQPLLLPLAERLGRASLVRAGFVSRRVQAPGGEVHLYDAPGQGTLPAIVLLHGLGSSATAFGPLLGRLRRAARRVVAPDHLGHGFSAEAARHTPEVLLAAVTHTIDALGEPVVLVGNSMGGALALGYAAARPDRVRALVLLSPAGAPSTEEEWADLERTFAMKTRADAARFIARLYHRAPWMMALLAHEFPAAFGRRAVRELFATSPREGLATAAELARLTMPILLLWGASERLLPESHLAHFRRALPAHARIERPPNVGHCPHLEDLRGVSERIVAFVREAVAEETATRAVG